MAATITYDDGADLGLLDGKTVAILGYGSQGHAHALNLKDSGVDVVVDRLEDDVAAVGLQGGPDRVDRLEHAGFHVVTRCRVSGHR